jgi:hypothetical protein
MNKVFGGHEKEPKAAHGGGKMKGGKMPVVHSHSKAPRRKISVGKRGMK